MKEADYIKATNLAKARIALDVLRSILDDTPSIDHIRDAREIVAMYINRLEKKCLTDEK